MTLLVQWATNEEGFTRQNEPSATFYCIHFQKNVYIEKFLKLREVCMHQFLAFHNHPLAGAEGWEIHWLMEWIYKTVFRNKAGISENFQRSSTMVCLMMY